MDIKDVENLANLARLDLAEDEKQALLLDMKGILEYVKQIEDVKISNINPVYDLKNVWRDDLPILESEKLFSRELILGQFPDSQDGFLKVKKIL